MEVGDGLVQTWKPGLRVMSVLSLEAKRKLYCHLLGVYTLVTRQEIGLQGLKVISNDLLGVDAVGPLALNYARAVEGVVLKRVWFSSMISQKGLGHNPEGPHFCGVVETTLDGELEELSSFPTSIVCSLCDLGRVT